MCTRKGRSAAKAGKQQELANEYISHIDDVLKPGDKVVLYCRVSGRCQAWRKNLDNQQACLEKVAKERGLPVVRCYRDMESGWKEEREKISKTAIDALKHDAAVLALSTDRFIRSDEYRSDSNPGAQPSRQEFENLKRATQGATLVTVLPPHMHWRKVRGFQSKLGQKAKGRKGGRPANTKAGDKKRRREQLKPDAIKLRKRGYTIRQISAELSVPKTTVQDWLSDRN